MSCAITLTPTYIGEDETLYVKIPKLEVGSCIIPSSLKPTGKLKNKSTKNWFLNNISACLQKNIRVRFGNIDVYHNSHESEFLLYKDFWDSEANRKIRVDEGIARENVRKLMSGDDSGAKTGTDRKVKDGVIPDQYAGEIVIPVGRMLNNQGVFAPRALNSDFEVEITFPEGKDIMVAHSSESVAGYGFEDLKLRYKKIVSPELYQMAEQSYISGRTVPFKCIDSFEVNKALWKKDGTLFNMRVNIPRRSMCAVVMLFWDDSKDSEKFVYPTLKMLN